MLRLAFSFFILMFLALSVGAQQTANAPFRNYLDLQPGQILNYYFSEERTYPQKEFHQQEANLEVRVISRSQNSIVVTAKITRYHLLEVKNGKKAGEFNSQYPPLDSSKVFLDRMMYKEIDYLVDFDQGKIEKLDSTIAVNIPVLKSALDTFFGMAFRKEYVSYSIMDNEYVQQRKFTKIDDNENFDYSFNLSIADSKYYGRHGYGFIDYDSSKHVLEKGKQCIIYSKSLGRQSNDTVRTNFHLLKPEYNSILFRIEAVHPENNVSISWNQLNFFPREIKLRPDIDQVKTLKVEADRLTKFELNYKSTKNNINQTINFLAGPGDTVDILLTDKINFDGNISHTTSAQIFEYQDLIKSQMVIRDSLVHPISPWEPMQYLAHHLSRNKFLDTLNYYQTQMLQFLDEKKTSLSEPAYYHLFYHVIYDVAIESMSSLETGDQENNIFLNDAKANNPYAEGVDMYHDFMGRMVLFRYREVDNSYRYPKPSDLYLFSRLLLSGYSLYVESARLLHKTLRGVTYPVENIYQEIYSVNQYEFFKKTLVDYYQNLVQFGSVSKGQKIHVLEEMLDTLDLGIDDQPFILVVLQQDEKANQEIKKLWRDSSAIANYNFLIINVSEIERENMILEDSVRANLSYITLNEHHPLFNTISSYGSYYLLLDRNHKVQKRVSLPIRVTPEEWQKAATVAKDPADYKSFAEILSLIFLFSLIIFGTITYFRHNKNQKVILLQKIQDFELKALRAQMNPHFMFNALNSIQSLINKNEIEQANLYLHRFAKLMRMVLNHSKENFVPLVTELEAVRIYCELEQLRHQFQFGLTVDPQIDQHQVEIPGMLIQPLVENAVIHAMTTRKEDGRLEIKLNKRDEILVVEVVDNGPGYSWVYQKERAVKHGLDLIYERLELLRKKFSVQVKLSVVKQAGAGTISSLQIHLHE